MQSNIKNGFFNIGTGITTSIQQLAKTMIKISGLKLEPQYEKALDGLNTLQEEGWFDDYLIEKAKEDLK